MTTELQKIKDRVRNLMAKSVGNGCTEAEAMTAMAKASELLALYDLELVDVLVDRPEIVTKEVFMPKARKDVMDQNTVAIAKFCDCFSYFRWNYGNFKKAGHTFYFVGYEQDVEMAVYLFEMIRDCIEREWELFKTTDVYINAKNVKGGRRHASSVFKRAMSKRIRQRLNAEKDARNSRGPMVGNGKSLAVVKLDNVKAEYEKQSGRKARYVTTYDRKIYNNFAHKSGTDAGNRANLNRPVSGGSDSPLMISGR
jgi:hypothetical protein